MKISNMNVIQTFSLSLIISYDLVGANYFRSNPIDTFDDDDEFKVRELDWNFIGKVFNDDEFFGNYDKDEIPKSINEEGDREDYLRNKDVCAGSDGSISRSNCRTPPSCSGKSSTLGKEKLCINRAFEPSKKDSWYIVSMKCIPVWENCDKCFCGYMKESYAKTGYCKFDDSTVNDDRVDVDCDRIEKIKILGRSYEYKTQSSESKSESSDSKKSEMSDSKNKKTSKSSDSKSKQDKKKEKSSDSKSKKDKSSDSKSEQNKKKDNSSDSSDSKSKNDKKKDKSSDSKSKNDKKKDKSSDSKSKQDKKKGKSSKSSDSKSKNDKKNKNKNKSSSSRKSKSKK